MAYQHNFGRVTDIVARTLCQPGAIILDRERNMNVPGNLKVRGDTKLCGNVEVQGDLQIDCITSTLGNAQVCANDDASVTMDLDPGIGGQSTAFRLDYTRDLSLMTSTAAGSNNFACGSFCTATGTNCFACGSTTNADGINCHAQGEQTTATGTNSHAEGQLTMCAGGGHAEGLRSTAIGARAHAEGDDTMASGAQSHAQGRLTVASGLRSFACGLFATAGHTDTFCWSDGTTFGTTADNQFAIRAGGQVRINNGAATELLTITDSGRTTWTYTPATSAHWSGDPTNMAEAIDRLAAAYFAVHGVVP